MPIEVSKEIFLEHMILEGIEEEENKIILDIENIYNNLRGNLLTVNAVDIYRELLKIHHGFPNDKYLVILQKLKKAKVIDLPSEIQKITYVHFLKKYEPVSKPIKISRAKRTAATNVPVGEPGNQSLDKNNQEIESLKKKFIDSINNLCKKLESVGPKKDSNLEKETKSLFISPEEQKKIISGWYDYRKHLISDTITYVGKILDDGRLFDFGNNTIESIKNHFNLFEESIEKIVKFYSEISPMFFGYIKSKLPNLIGSNLLEISKFENEFVTYYDNILKDAKLKEKMLEDVEKNIEKAKKEKFSDKFANDIQKGEAQKAFNQRNDLLDVFWVDAKVRLTSYHSSESNSYIENIDKIILPFFVNNSPEFWLWIADEGKESNVNHGNVFHSLQALHKQFYDTNARKEWIAKRGVSLESPETNVETVKKNSIDLIDSLVKKFEALKNHSFPNLRKETEFLSDNKEAHDVLINKWMLAREKLIRDTVTRIHTVLGYITSKFRGGNEIVEKIKELEEKINRLIVIYTNTIPLYFSYASKKKSFIHDDEFFEIDKWMPEFESMFEREKKESGEKNELLKKISSKIEEMKSAQMHGSGNIEKAREIRNKIFDCWKNVDMPHAFLGYPLEKCKNLYSHFEKDESKFVLSVEAEFWLYISETNFYERVLKNVQYETYDSLLEVYEIYLRGGKQKWLDKNRQHFKKVVLELKHVDRAGKKAWVSEIKDRKFSKNFLSAVFYNKGIKKFELFEGGYYEYEDAEFNRQYCKIEDGKLIDLTKEEVFNHFNK